MQADDRLDQSIDFHSLLNEAFANIQKDAKVLAFERLDEDFGPDGATDTAQLSQAPGIIGIGLLSPDGEELCRPADFGDVDPPGGR